MQEHLTTKDGIMCTRAYATRISAPPPRGHWHRVCVSGALCFAGMFVRAVDPLGGRAWPASPVATRCQGNPCSTGIRWVLPPVAQLG